MHSKKLIRFVPFRSYIIFISSSVLLALLKDKFSANETSLFLIALVSYFLLFVPWNIELCEGSISKKYLFININKINLEIKYETTLYQYINRLRIKEANLEIQSDKYYKIKLNNEHFRMTIKRKYKDKNGLSVIDYLPKSIFRKAKLIEKINWLR